MTQALAHRHVCGFPGVDDRNQGRPRERDQQAAREPEAVPAGQKIHPGN